MFTWKCPYLQPPTLPSWILVISTERIFSSSSLRSPWQANRRRALESAHPRLIMHCWQFGCKFAPGDIKKALGGGLPSQKVQNERRYLLCCQRSLRRWSLIRNHKSYWREHASAHTKRHHAADTIMRKINVHRPNDRWCSLPNKESRVRARFICQPESITR